MKSIRILNDESVKQILDIKSTIKCVETAYVLKAKHQARLFSMISEEIIEGKAEMDIKSGMLDGENVFGLKLVSWFGDNVKQNLPAITGLTMIFDLVNGFPKGILNASYMTGMRTGAAGALGIKYLARVDSSVLGVVGTGKMAIFQIAATLSLIPGIKKVNIYDPMEYENAHKFQAGIKNELGKIINDLNDKDNALWLSRIDEVIFVAVDNLESMIKESDALITITPSRKPLLKKEWIKAGTHISCIGADVAGKQELDKNIFKGAVVCVDDCQQAVTVGETQSAFRAKLIESGDLIEIGNLIIGKAEGRKSDEDITIFDSTGISLQDLSVSNTLLLKAEELNIGKLVKI